MTETPKICLNRVSGLYCRVSTLDQISGLESQIRTLKEYCEKNRITNYEIFTDEGISGAKYSRPALDRMMSLVREGKIERVICYSFSRFARSVTHFERLHASQKQAKKETLKVKEQAESQAQLQVLDMSAPW